MTYAERLAEFVKVTGHKPGEMNRPSKTCKDGVRCGRIECGFCRYDSRGSQHTNAVSLEPASQSAGPGRCNRFTRVGALGDPSPCKLPVNHEGPHEP